MKIRAGLKLWGRKPSVIPRTMMAMSGPMFGAASRPSWSRRWP